MIPLAYLDPGSGGPGPVELVLMLIVLAVLALLAVYGLARFIAWAVQR